MSNHWKIFVDQDLKEEVRMEGEETARQLGMILDVMKDVVLYPSEMISILNQIRYKPKPVDGKNSSGKMSYFMDIYNEEGIIGFSRGLMTFIMIHYMYAFLLNLVDKESQSTMIKFYGEEAVTTEYPSQLNLEYRLNKMFLRETSAVILTHPLHVLQARQVAQFIGKETRYSAFIVGLLELIRLNGVCGLFYGLLPRLVATLVLNFFVETADWFYECYAESLRRNPPRNESLIQHFILAHRQESKMLNKRLARILGAILTERFDKISTNMEIDDSGLAADKNEERMKYSSWLGPAEKYICQLPQNHTIT